MLRHLFLLFLLTPLFQRPLMLLLLLRFLLILRFLLLPRGSLSSH
jgi:hypothetical protein